MAISGHRASKGTAWQLRRGLRARLSLLFLCFIAISITAPAFAGGFSPKSDELPGLFGDRIVICTGSGMKVIHLDETGKPIPDKDEDHAPAVGFCTPMSAAALSDVRNNLFTKLRPLPIPEFPRPSAAISIPHGTEHRPALTRGPPVLV